MDDQPRRFGIAKIRITNLVPKRFLIIPEITHDIAHPNDIIETAHENSFGVITNLWSGSRIKGPLGADHPNEIP